MGKGGGSPAKARSNYFLMSQQCRGNNGILILLSLPQGDFLLRRAGQRAVCPLAMKSIARH